jgi:hypothetical protein
MSNSMIVDVPMDLKFSPPKNGWIEKLMVQSEIALQELSNDWYMYVSRFQQSYILCPTLVSPSFCHHESRVNHIKSYLF